MLDTSQPFVFKAVNLGLGKPRDFPKLSRELVTERAETRTQGAGSVPPLLQTTVKCDPGFLEMQNSQNLPNESRGQLCSKQLDYIAAL